MRYSTVILVLSFAISQTTATPFLWFGNSRSISERKTVDSCAPPEADFLKKLDGKIKGTFDKVLKDQSISGVEIDKKIDELVKEQGGDVNVSDQVESWRKAVSEKLLERKEGVKEAFTEIKKVIKSLNELHGNKSLSKKDIDAREKEILKEEGKVGKIVKEIRDSASCQESKEIRFFDFGRIFGWGSKNDENARKDTCTPPEPDFLKAVDSKSKGKFTKLLHDDKMPLGEKETSIDEWAKEETEEIQMSLLKWKAAVEAKLKEKEVSEESVLEVLEKLVQEMESIEYNNQLSKKEKGTEEKKVEKEGDKKMISITKEIRTIVECKPRKEEEPDDNSGGGAVGGGGHHSSEESEEATEGNGGVVPAKPEQPEKPSVPEQPEQPERPQPEQPVQPSIPEVPQGVNPGMTIPLFPELSGAPQQPQIEEETLQPVVPQGPQIPAKPQKPEEYSEEFLEYLHNQPQKVQPQKPEEYSEEFLEYLHNQPQKVQSQKPEEYSEEFLEYLHNQPQKVQPQKPEEYSEEFLEYLQNQQNQNPNQMKDSEQHRRSHHRGLRPVKPV